MDVEDDVILDDPATVQSDTETTDADTPTELPTDPEALRQFALDAEQKRIAAERQARIAKRDAERQADKAHENEEAKKHWFGHAQRLESELQARGGTPAANGANTSKPPSTSTDVKAALKGLDLADYVTADDGVEKLVSDLEARGVIATPQKIEQMLNDRERNQQQQLDRYRTVASEYDLVNNPDLQAEADKEFERLSSTHAHLDDTARFELATARAAAFLGVQPGTKSKAVARTTTQPPANRLRAAQGGPANRSAAPVQRPVTVTPELRKMATKTAGSNLSDDVLKRVAQRVNAANANRKG